MYKYTHICVYVNNNLAIINGIFSTAFLLKVLRRKLAERRSVIDKLFANHLRNRQDAFAAK